MRITLIGPTAPYRGGIVAHTEGARDALAASANRVDVCGFSRVYPRWLLGGRSGARPAVRRGRPSIDALAPRSWLEVADAISTDVLLVQYWTPFVAPALYTVLSRARARRRLVICHNVTPHERMPGARMLFEGILRRCDAAIFHSRAMLDTVRRATLERVETAVVPMPLLMPPEAELRCPPELARSPDGDTELVALVGHIRRYKGLGVLDRAWDSVRRDRPTARLLVAGEPIGARRVLARLRSRDRGISVVSRYLEDDELRWVLAHARVVVLPYTGASQSGVLPLALRLSRQIVVSDAGGLGEQIETARTTVSCVPAGDAVALARALHRALASSPDAAPRAPRQDAERAGCVDFASSWHPFVRAVTALTAACDRVGDCSNMRPAGPSVSTGKSDDEAPGQAWYDAGRSVSRRAEIQ